MLTADHFSQSRYVRARQMHEILFSPAEVLFVRKIGDLRNNAFFSDRDVKEVPDTPMQSNMEDMPAISQANRDVEKKDSSKPWLPVDPM